MRTIEAQTTATPNTTTNTTPQQGLDPQTTTAALSPTPAQPRTAPVTLEELRDSLKAEIDYGDAVAFIGQKGLQATVDRNGEKVTLPNVLAHDKLKSLHISGVDLTLESAPKLLNKNGDVVSFGEIILENKNDRKALKALLAGTVFDEHTKFCSDPKQEKEVRKILKKIASPYNGDGAELHNLRGFGGFSPSDRQGIDGPDWQFDQDAGPTGTFQIDADEDETPAVVPAAGPDDLIVTTSSAAPAPDANQATPGNQGATTPATGTQTADELEAIAAAELATKQADARAKEEEDRVRRKEAFFNLIDATAANEKPAIEASLKTIYESEDKTLTFTQDNDSLTQGVHAIVAETSKLSARDRLKVVEHLIALKDDPDATGGQQRMAAYIGAQIADWHANNPVTFTGVADVLQAPAVQANPVAPTAAPITARPVIPPLPTATVPPVQPATNQPVPPQTGAVQPVATNPAAGSSLENLSKAVP